MKESGKTVSKTVGVLPEELMELTCSQTSQPEKLMAQEFTFIPMDLIIQVISEMDVSMGKENSSTNSMKWHMTGNGKMENQTDKENKISKISVYTKEIF